MKRRRGVFGSLTAAFPRGMRPLVSLLLFAETYFFRLLLVLDRGPKSVEEKKDSGSDCLLGTFNTFVYYGVNDRKLSTLYAGHIHICFSVYLDHHRINSFILFVVFHRNDRSGKRRINVHTISAF